LVDDSSFTMVDKPSAEISGWSNWEWKPELPCYCRTRKYKGKALAPIKRGTYLTSGSSGQLEFEYSPMSEIESQSGEDMVTLLTNLHTVSQPVQSDTHIFHSPQNRQVTIRRSSNSLDSFVEIIREGLDAERAAGTSQVSRESFPQVNGQNWREHSLPNVESIIRQQWGSKLLATMHTVRYQVSWDLPLYVRSCFPPGQLLDNIMTITGGATTAFAANVSEYFSMTWPVAGPVLLQAINELIVDSRKGM
jgi:hypothetical protein